MKPTKKKSTAWMEDGDSAHWGKENRKTKRVTPSDANSSVKYAGKEKKTRKRIATKK